MSSPAPPSTLVQVRLVVLPYPAKIPLAIGLRRLSGLLLIAIPAVTSNLTQVCMAPITQMKLPFHSATGTCSDQAPLVKNGDKCISHISGLPHTLLNVEDHPGLEAVTPTISLRDITTLSMSSAFVVALMFALR